MIENLELQRAIIIQILHTALLSIPKRASARDLNLIPLPTGIDVFAGTKCYLDTSSVNENGPSDYRNRAGYNERPSRANARPIANSVWFAKMKGGNKPLLITSLDDDLIEHCLLSTGFMGLKENHALPLPLLYAFITSPEFLLDRDRNSTGTLMEGVTNSTFQNIKFPRLNASEAVHFKKAYSPLICVLSKIRKEEILLKKSKQYLLNKYF